MDMSGFLEDENLRFVWNICTKEGAKIVSFMVESAPVSLKNEIDNIQGLLMGAFFTPSS